ncbi:cytochrome b/b6 domain-containing protein [Sphingopyxis sp.]|uniref:cytochrome b/b6 domain-containing protein n=1 Tax=Sphingopyxis sp. TaxID=1908224 RepID=UPI001DE78471|nr:cytochrome b/b6 domain-containing protein [Sphingopyxis sp.]MBW8294483.1 cytochrome b/b6 domain-containing protein [Sphingopyxis sp.]
MSHSDHIPQAGRILVWDLPLRLFHWFLVAAIAVAFLSAEEGSVLNQWHIASGWVAAVLIAFRLVWGFVGGEHARFSGAFKGGGLAVHIKEMFRLKPEATLGHNPVGWIASFLLIVVSGITIATGAQLVTGGAMASEDLHELVGWSLLALVALHVAAVALMSVLTRDNLVRAMIVGSKSGARHSAFKSARAPSLFAYMAGLAAIASAIWGVITIDPQAFMPRTTEMAEIESGETDEVEMLREESSVEEVDK